MTTPASTGSCTPRSTSPLHPIPQHVERANAAVQVSGGVLLVTVIPGNLGAHMFWSEIDPERKAQQRHAFPTDVGLLGGLIIGCADTAGKPSLAWRGRLAARRLTAGSPLKGNLGERLQEGLHAGVRRSR